jgi:para-nitrobenzyl esterase
MKRTSRNIFLLILLSPITISLSAQHDNIKQEGIRPVIVSTNSGFVRGIFELPELAVFLGIPYAAAPVGKLRWKPPAEVNKWNDTLRATQYGPSCPQPSDDKENFSEDCLYLNVFTTVKNLKGSLPKKPVMVWIHGGGFGSGSARGYDGRKLVLKNVVVVTINYRIGPFGFLDHPVLESASPHGSAGNYGLLDQIAALQWVKRNITAFGGDTSNVTIWGESAGAFSVGALLASPLAKGLFHKAILESGTGLMNGIQSREMARRYAVSASENVGIRGDDSTVLRTLYALSSERLLEIYSQPKRLPLQGFRVWYSPVIDGWVLPKPLDKAINGGDWNKVPILLGSNMNEGAYFQRENHIHDTVEYYDILGSKSLGDTAGLLRTVYAVKDTSEILSRSQDLVGDLAFGAPARALARMATANHSTVYLYYFTRTSKDKNGRDIKALHSTELPFVFGFTLGNWKPYAQHNGISSRDEFLAEAMSDYWTNFAIYGNPNGIKKTNPLPDWPLFELKSNSYLEIGPTIQANINLRKLPFDVVDQFSIQKGEVRY